MKTLDSYIASLSPEVYRKSRNLEQAERMLRTRKQIWALPDQALCIGSPKNDPVYNKIQEVWNGYNSHNTTPRISIIERESDIVRERSDIRRIMAVNRYYNRITQWRENSIRDLKSRSMTEQDYHHIWDTPVEQLVDEITLDRVQDRTKRPKGRWLCFRYQRPKD